MTATENGVGPINKTTPFNVKKIRALLPALQVKQAIGASESEEFPILKVYDQGQFLLVIYPDETQRKIFSIDIASKRVQTSNGVKRGVLFSQIYPTGRPKDCTPGLEQKTGQVFCPAPNSKHFLYVFTGKDFPEGRASLPQNSTSGKTQIHCLEALREGEANESTSLDRYWGSTGV